MQFVSNALVLKHLFVQVIAYTGNEDAKKFVFDGEVALDKLKVKTLSLSLDPILYVSMLLSCIFLCAWKRHGVLNIVNVFSAGFWGGLSGRQAKTFL